MKNKKNSYSFDIEQFLPNFDEEGKKAFDKIYKIIKKNPYFYQLKDDEQIYEFIMLLATTHIQNSKNNSYAISNEDNLIIKNSEIFINSYNKHLSDLMPKAFWKAEYIKRNYFLTKKNKVKDLSKLKEFIIISKWRLSKDEESVHNNCNLNYCFYRNEPLKSDAILKTPFFYNFECTPIPQKALMPSTNYYLVIKDCLFKTEVMAVIIAYFNAKIASDNNKIKDPRLEIYGLSDSYIETYNPKYLKELDTLCKVTYEYGLSVLDLFSLTSPEKLLNDSVKNKTKIEEEIIKLVPPDFFLKQDSIKLQETEEIIEKLNDPTNMAVIRRNPINNRIDPSLIETKLKNYEFVIGIDSDVLSNDFCLKKKLDTIKNALLDFKPNNNFIIDPENHQNHYIIFAFNPTAPSFIRKSGVSKKIIDDIELVINSYRTYYMPLNTQIEKFQKENTKVYNRINNVNNYQETDQQRAIGLYIWDQENFFDKEISETIHAFIESDLWHKLEKLSPKQIEKRKIGNLNSNKFIIGTQEDYNKIYKYYLFASECIKCRELLTGSEVEKKLYKGMKKIRLKQLVNQQKKREENKKSTRKGQVLKSSFKGDKLH